MYGIHFYKDRNGVAPVYEYLQELRSKPDKNSRIKLAITLSKARKARGLTQKKLSELAGVKQSAISRIERGDVNIRLGTLAKLSAALNKKMQVVPLD